VASVQGPDPDITISYDVTPALAAKVRRNAFAEFAQKRTLLAVPHQQDLPFQSRQVMLGDRFKGSLRCTLRQTALRAGIRARFLMNLE
jgi:hypothetical protein